MQSAFEQFLRAHPEWGAVTRECYLAWSQLFADFLRARELSWHQARRTDLQDFQGQQQWAPNRKGGLKSANTIYQGMRLLRAFYSWAQAETLVQQNPMHDWILPRPANVSQTLLSWKMVQHLFNLPDLGSPKGQRDLLLLHLLYQGVTQKRCLRLELHSELPDDPTLQAVTQRYLSSGRPSLVMREHGKLLVNDCGQPYETSEGLRQRVLRYARVLQCPNLCARTLRESLKEHQAELASRRRNYEGRPEENMGEIS